MILTVFLIFCRSLMPGLDGLGSTGHPDGANSDSTNPGK